MDPWLRGAGVALLGFGAVVAAAKFHGREVRLRREREGHRQVDFRRGNHPWVEALWRRDRRTFWPAFAVFAAAALVLVAIGGLPLPAWAAAPVLLGWAFTLAFLVAGARWARELLRLHACPAWSSLGFFLLPLALAGAEAALVWLGD